MRFSFIAAAALAAGAFVAANDGVAKQVRVLRGRVRMRKGDRARVRLEGLGKKRQEKSGQFSLMHLLWEGTKEKSGQSTLMHLLWGATKEADTVPCPPLRDWFQFWWAELVTPV